METIKGILLLAYIVAGWWAANRTVFANYVMFGSWGSIVTRKLLVAFICGWALIPVAIIKAFLSK